MSVSLIKETPVIDYFDTYRTSPELSVNVPPASEGEAWNIRIDIAAMGGGTVLEAYTDTTWIYAVYVDGKMVYSGADLRCTGTPANHLEMIGTLISFITCDSEHANEYPAVLREEYADRLYMFLGEDA